MRGRVSRLVSQILSVLNSNFMHKILFQSRAHPLPLAASVCLRERCKQLKIQMKKKRRDERRAKGAKQVDQGDHIPSIVSQLFGSKNGEGKEKSDHFPVKLIFSTPSCSVCYK